MHSDDGIVLRLPDTDGEVPGADLAIFEPDELEAMITSELGGSALFASRFRECAARSLLLPRRDPRRRTPLWQQRQRANQLLQVASEFGEFPVVLEAMRECLQDVYDVPGLVGLMRDLSSRRVKLVEVETPSASPFARSLLFGYVGMFLYEGDAPLAERRAQALSLDSAMLAELLGATELRELLDADALAEVEREVARLAPERHANGPDAVHDLLRAVGDLTTDEAIARGATAADLAALEESRRAIRVRIAGEQRWIAIEDAGRVRDALGAAVPVGVPEAFTEPVKDPLGDLVSRFARTHGPFHPADVAARLGLGVAVVATALARLATAGRLVQGEFRPDGVGTEWCDAEVLRMVRRRSLAALRKEVEPVPPDALARFIPSWQGVGARSSRGVDGVLRAVEQLAGVPVPASALESLILPARVADYAPTMLDELTLAGEVVWTGAGALAGNDGWVALAPAELAPLLLPPLEPVDGLAASLLAALEPGSAMFFRALADRAVDASDDDVSAAVWELIWAGALTNDTLAPLRARLDGVGSHRARAQGRARRAPATGATAAWPASRRPHRRAAACRTRCPDAGRRFRPATTTRPAARSRRPTRCSTATGWSRADRWRPSASAAASPASIPCSKPPKNPDAPAAATSSTGSAPPSSRCPARSTGCAGRPVPTDVREPAPALVLAATDPANPFGAALPWPAAPAPEGGGRGHQPARKAGALVVLLDGACVLYVERGGRSLLSFTDDTAVLQPAADALALAVRDGALGKLAVERADGVPIVASPLGDALASAGFRPTPRGLRLRG